MITVVIVDDHKLVREGFRLLLGRTKDIQVVGEGRDGVEAVQLAERLQPDVILMDLTMPRMDGIQATKEICARGNGIAIIMVSMVSDESVIAQALASGAKGWISKNDCYDQLVAAIRDAKS